MKYLKRLILVGTLLMFSGCAQKANMEQMTVKQIEYIDYKPSFQNSITILSVDGGKTTYPTWSSQISSDDFKKALIASLIHSGLYSKDGRYRLKVEIIELEKPFAGLDMTVTMTVKYTLLDFASSSILFTKIITKPYTATFGDAFLGVKRAQLANEGSGRENIKALLKELSI